MWTIEPLRTATSRDARVLERARRRAEDELAGRTVWCVAGLPAGRDAAWALRARVRFGGESGVAVDCLALTASEPLAELGERLEEMLHGAAQTGDGLSHADGATWASGRLDGEALFGDAVAPDDVVVLHDALAAVIAEAARERGAHVAWRVDAAASPADRLATAAWAFLRPRTRAIDGYVGEWVEPRARRGRIGSAIPSTGAVSGWDASTGEAPVAWGNALAALVHDDRHEMVGGTVRARPGVAIR
jgi:hypothetical protein